MEKKVFETIFYIFNICKYWKWEKRNKQLNIKHADYLFQDWPFWKMSDKLLDKWYWLYCSSWFGIDKVYIKKMNIW